MTHSCRFQTVLLAITAVSGVWAQDSLVPQPQPQPLPAPEREVSWKKLIPNIAHDQLSILTFPSRLSQNRNWVPAAGVAGVTAGLNAADPAVGRYFRQSGSYSGFNKAFSSTNTMIGIIAVPAVTYVAGMVAKDSYAKNTALLAAEAFADSQITVTFFKATMPRLRPSSIPPSGDFGDTWFEGRSGGWNSGASFPSGHAASAFAVAAVMSRRYGKQHRWVPYVAYGLAGTIAVSRITLSKHFPSDVFAGAAIGYSIGRFSVLHQ